MPAYDPKANRPRPIESDHMAVIDSLLPPEPRPAPVVEAPAVVEASSNLIRNAVIAAAVLGLVVTAVAASKRGR